MRPEDRDFLFYLTDIVDSIKKVIVCTEGFSDFNQLEADWIRYDADIIWQIATRHLPENLKQIERVIDFYQTS